MRYEIKKIETESPTRRGTPKIISPLMYVKPAIVIALLCVTLPKDKITHECPISNAQRSLINAHAI
ncbi:MAG: hypothetical protein NWQ46_06885 [Spirosomaceae bacterium]|nr:hypothetical protein [Spirosomataceae bacterium]MDP5139582.1 hypothetical protein [Spirosomataceae bacterium]